MRRPVGKDSVDGNDDARATWTVDRALLYAEGGMWCVRLVRITASIAAILGTKCQQLCARIRLAEIGTSTDRIASAGYAAGPTLTRSSE